MSIGRIIVDLLAKTGSFDTDLNRSAKLAARRAKEIDEAFARAGRRIGIALAGMAAVAAAAFKVSVDRMDALSKAAQRVGLPTEEFSALAYSASLADVSIGGLQTGLSRLNRSLAEAQNATSEQAKLFRALDIETRNSNGTLRDRAAVFADFAARFKEFGGSQEIVAAGVKIFGRQFEELIPMLKDGREGLELNRRTLEELGGVLSGNAGRAAEAFNDNLTRLGVAARVSADILSQELLKVAVPLTDALFELAKEAINADGGIRNMAKSDVLREWAQNGAIAVAVLGESLVFMSKAALAVAGSFSAVWADLSVASALSRNMFGGFMFESNRKALADALAGRNKTVEEANKRLIDLINYDGARVSNALRKQFEGGGGASFSDARFETERQRLAEIEKERLRRQRELMKLFEGIGKTAKTETDKAAEAVSRMLAKIEGDIARFGKSDIDSALRDFWDAGADPAQLNRALELLTKLDNLKKSAALTEDADKTRLSVFANLDRENEALRQQAEAWMDLADPMRVFIRDLEKIDEMLAKGMFGKGPEAEQMASNIKQALAGVREELSEMEVFLDQASRNIQDALGQGLYDILDGNFESIGKSFGNMIKRMLAEAIAADIAGALFGKGGTGGLIGSLFGLPGRAAGGPVSAGSAYLVGEQGPEVFMPNTSGTIIPNGKGVGVSIIQNISVGSSVSRGEVMTAMSVAKEAAKREIAESMRRGGAFA